MKTKLETLRDTRAKAEAELRSTLDAHESALETRSLTDDEVNAATAGEARLAQIDAAIVRAEAEEKREKDIAEERARQLGAGAGSDPDIRVGHEPLTYGPAQDGYSFYRDLLMSATSAPGQRGAMDRLIRHQTEVEKLANGPQTTTEARSARKAIQEIRRQNKETRAESTGTSSLGDWAPPVYALDDTAPYRDYGRAYIDQLHKMPLPESGMVVNIPRVTTPSQAVNQTGGSSTQGNGENVSVATRDMTGTYGAGTVQTVISNDLVSQLYLDRFGPASFAADQLILQDQSTQVNKLLDAFAWDQTWSLIQTSQNYEVYNDTAFNAASFKKQVHGAKAALRKAAGIVTMPTHFFADADLWESIEGAYDSSNRPFVVPQGVAFNPLAVGEETNVPEGYTGFRFASLPAFVDQNLWAEWNGNNGATPVYTNDHPALVADLSIGAEWLEGAPVIRVLPQPYASQLTVLIQQFVYAAFVPRYPGAFWAVVGSGTGTSYLV